MLLFTWNTMHVKNFNTNLWNALIFHNETIKICYAFVTLNTFTQERGPSPKDFYEYQSCERHSGNIKLKYLHFNAIQGHVKPLSVQMKFKILLGKLNVITIWIIVLKINKFLFNTLSNIVHMHGVKLKLA